MTLNEEIKTQQGIHNPAYCIQFPRNSAASHRHLSESLPNV